MHTGKESLNSRARNISSLGRTSMLTLESPTTAVTGASTETTYPPPQLATSTSTSAPAKYDADQSWDAFPRSSFSKFHDRRRSDDDHFELEHEEGALLGRTDADALQGASQGGSTLLAAFMNCCNSIIGAGIIGLPFALKEAGFITGVGLLVVLTIIVDWTIRILIHSSRISGQTTTYQGLVEFCFGKPGLIAISIFQFVFAFGAMAAYTVIVGDTIPSVLLYTFPNLPEIPLLSLFASRTFVVCLTTVSISFPLSLYRDMSKLAKASAFALIAISIILIAILIEGPKTPVELRGDPLQRWSVINGEVIQAIGVISFAFVCHHNTFLIYGSLRKPTLDRFAIVTHLSTGVSLFASSVIAVAGYWVFVEKTKGNILNNFSHDNALVNLARFCFGLNMFSTFPLETFVAREVIEHYMWPNEIISTQRHVALTTVLVLAAMIIGIGTCDLGFVLELTGGFSATALAFILPPACFLKLASGPMISRKKIPAVLCISFGIFVMITSTSLSLHKFFNRPENSGGCGIENG